MLKGEAGVEFICKIKCYVMLRLIYIFIGCWNLFGELGVLSTVYLNNKIYSSVNNLDNFLSTVNKAVPEISSNLNFRKSYFRL